MPITQYPSQTELAYYSQFIGIPIESKFIADYVAPESPDLFIERLDYHGIAQLALEQGKLPGAVRKQLAQRNKMLAANELLKSKALVDLFTTFASAGLQQDIITLKGTALAYSLYKQPWLRPRSDTDCLINKNNKNAFEAIFIEQGFQKKLGIEGDYVSYQSTFCKRLGQHSELSIDLHWRVSNRQILSQSYSIEELVITSQPLDKLSPHIVIPSHIDNLLLAAIHRTGHHTKEERLAWLFDIHLLCGVLNHSDRKQERQQKWQQLCEQAKQKKIAGITLDALQLCQHTLQTSIPSHVIESLELSKQDNEPSQFFLNRELPEWRYFLHDLKGLSGTVEKLKFIQETVLPNSTYLKERMQTNSLLKAYLQRSYRGFKRVLK